MIQWRALLTDINIPWRESGKNVGRGNLGVCCPFCGDDFGYHLNLSLGKEAYYCYREPAHAGYNMARLIMAWGSTYEEAKKLIFLHTGGQSLVPVRKPKPVTDMTARWDRFQPLAKPHLEYLRVRGFVNAREVAERYDLRCAAEGKWALRILFPIKEQHAVVAWTGRDIVGNLGVKYLTSEELNSSFVYCPRVPAEKALIVEGPIDALKIAAAEPEWAGVALLGKGLGLGKLMRLRGLVRGCQGVYFAPDPDVPIAPMYGMLRELAQVARNGNIELAKIPPGREDAGQMPYHEIRAWLRGI